MKERVREAEDCCWRGYKVVDLELLLMREALGVTRLDGEVLAKRSESAGLSP